MKKVAIIGALSAAVIALVVVAASWSVTRDGKKVKVGVRSAQACSQTEPADCLPQLDFVDTEGTDWPQELMAGKVVMINFWATWCHPCQAEVPALTATYQRYADKGFVLLGVMVDADSVGPSALDTFAKRWNLDYPVVPLDGTIWNEFGAPDVLPTTFIYDRTGKLRLRHRGALSESALEDVVEELLNEPAPSEL